MTFEQFQQAMISHAKKMQGEHYEGDDFWLQPEFKEQWENGDKPEDAVDMEMAAWD